jgi:hypothetical protein
VVTFTALPLYPGRRDNRSPLCKRLGRFRSRCGHYREQKNILPLSGIEPDPSVFKEERKEGKYGIKTTEKEVDGKRKEGKEEQRFILWC